MDHVFGGASPHWARALPLFVGVDSNQEH